MDSTGTSALRRLGGMLKFSPLLAGLFLVPALSLAGIPPLSGFVAKLALIQAGLEVTAYVPVAVATAVGLLTLMSMNKIWNRVFWQPAINELPAESAPKGMTVATSALLAVSLILTLVAAPLFSYAERAAEDLLARTPYIEGVLSQGDRGAGTSPIARFEQ